jgi:membrane fusion protein, heavy metal efflux system
MRSATTTMNSNFCAKFIAILSLWVSFSPTAFSYGGEVVAESSSEVKIDAATAQSLGIKVAPVQKQKLSVEIVATGQIELLSNQKVEITSPIAGKILQLLVQSGNKVKAGQAVATVTNPELGDLRSDAASLRRAQTELQFAQEGYRHIAQITKVDREQALRQLIAAQNRLSREQQLINSGSLMQAAKTNYQRQRQIAKAEIDAAQYTVNFAAANYQRDLKLAAAGYGTQQKTLESQSRLAEARAILAKALNQSAQTETELRKAQSDLPLRGLREAEKQLTEAKGQLAKAVNQKSLIAADSQRQKAKSAVLIAQNRQSLNNTTYNNQLGQLGNIGSQNGVITVKSPIDGTVTVHVTSPEENRDVAGQLVPKAGAKIMTITNDQQVLATANIYEKDLTKVKIGQEATVKVGSTVFTGIVKWIGTAVKGQTPVIPVQVAISNGSSLRSGMSAELRLLTDESTALSIAIPSASVVEAEGKKIVYVQNGTIYQAVNVEIGQTVGDLVEVKSGLFAGDQVVMQQAMQIYTQSLKTPPHSHKLAKDAAKTSAPGGWEMPSPWWLVIPGILATGSGAWWFIKKRRDDDIYGVEEIVQVEMIVENAASKNIHNLDLERIPTEIIDVEITDIKEIIENDDDRANHRESNSHARHNIKQHRQIVDRMPLISNATITND